MANKMEVKMSITSKICFIFVLLMSMVVVCRYGFTQEMREETNMREVFSCPYPVGGETPATEGEMVSPNLENMEVSPESVAENETYEDMMGDFNPQLVEGEMVFENREQPNSPQEIPLPSDSMEKSVTPERIDISLEEEKGNEVVPVVTFSDSFIERKGREQPCVSAKVSHDEAKSAVIPQSVSVSSDKKMDSAACPVAQPLNIMERRNVLSVPKASERIKGMEKSDNIEKL